MKSNLVKILATLGLIVAIALILKGVFGVGKIGFKKISKTSEFPILKCVSDNNGKDYVDIIDLQNIKDKEPADIKTEQNRANAEFAWFGISQTSNLSNSYVDEEYYINFIKNEDGMQKGYTLTINKDSGIGRYSIPKSIPVGSNERDTIDSYMDATNLKTICEKIKRNKL